jgi:hypothetical protein
MRRRFGTYSFDSFLALVDPFARLRLGLGTEYNVGSVDLLIFGFYGGK